MNILARLRPTLRRLTQDERGLSTVEYVILLVLIAAGGVALWVKLGSSINGKLNSANSELDAVSVDAVQKGDK